MSAGRGVLLAQVRPSGTSAATGYTAPSTQNVEITRIVICNTTGTAAAASVFHDDDGTTFDQTTALRYAKSVPANDAIELGGDELGTGYTLSAGGAIGVQTGTGSALTFSIYGAVETRAPQ